MSVDHVYSVFKTPVVYTYEFRDPQHGHILPPEFIIPNCQEVMDSLIVLVAKTRQFGFLG